MSEAGGLGLGDTPVQMYRSNSLYSTVHPAFLIKQSKSHKVRAIRMNPLLAMHVPNLNPILPFSPSIQQQPQTPRIPPSKPRPEQLAVSTTKRDFKPHRLGIVDGHGQVARVRSPSKRRLDRDIVVNVVDFDVFAFGVIRPEGVRLQSEGCTAGW